MPKRKKVIYISTIPLSLNILLRGQLRMLTEHYEVIAVSSPGNDLDLVREREGVRIKSVFMERRISLFSDILSLLSLIKLFHKEKPWMVHSLTPKAGLLAMMAARICNVPIRIHTFTGLIFPSALGLKKKILICSDKITCSCSTHINPEGKGVMNNLESFNITNKPLKIIGNGNINGVDCNYYKCTQHILEQANKNRIKGYLTFCFVGRIVHDKGIEELISSFVRIQKIRSKIRLILVGTFEQKLDPIKEKTIEVIKNNENIEYVGWQQDIRPFLAASDIFIFPSYREGFPNVLLQAGAMGLPSIVTDINGSNEIIINGENGIIIPPRNENELYSAMIYMIDNEAKRHSMALCSRNLIESRYEQQYLWKELLIFYKSLENGN